MNISLAMNIINDLLILFGDNICLLPCNIRKTAVYKTIKNFTISFEDAKWLDTAYQNFNSKQQSTPLYID